MAGLSIATSVATIALKFGAWLLTGSVSLWSDALESRLTRAAEVAGDKVVRAYRLYLAGSAMSFERGWISLHQMLAARLSGNVDDGPIRGAQSVFPFQRSYIYK